MHCAIHVIIVTTTNSYILKITYSNRHKKHIFFAQFLSPCIILEARSLCLVLLLQIIISRKSIDDFGVGTKEHVVVYVPYSIAINFEEHRIIFSQSRFDPLIARVFFANQGFFKIAAQQYYF